MSGYYFDEKRDVRIQSALTNGTIGRYYSPRSLIQEGIMAQTLELFAKQNDLYLVVTKTSTKETEFFQERSGRIRTRRTGGTEWRYDLRPPVLARTVRVTQKRKAGASSMGPVWPAKGATRREARNKLLAVICGGVLEYSNYFDRQCGDDLKIKVPKNLQ